LNGDIARRRDLVSLGDRGDHLVGRQAVGPEALRVSPDDDGALVAPERRRRRDAGQRGEHRPDDEQGLVLDLADGPLALEDQVAHGNTAGVEAHDKGRNRVGRHERARPVDVADGLGHRAGHIRAGMEKELHQGDALDVLAFDVFDAGDVQEVVLVVVGQEPFHLLRVHAAVGLGHVDDRRVQVRKNVHRHAKHGQPGPQHDGDNADHHRDWMPHGKDNGIHRSTRGELLLDNRTGQRFCPLIIRRRRSPGTPMTVKNG